METPGALSHPRGPLSDTGIALRKSLVALRLGHAPMPHVLRPVGTQGSREAALSGIIDAVSFDAHESLASSGTFSSRCPGLVRKECSAFGYIRRKMRRPVASLRTRSGSLAMSVCVPVFVPGSGEGTAFFCGFLGIQAARKEMVPKGGIEPPTLRFSVVCSTN